MTSTRKIVVQNKKARFEYFIEETLEAGIVLTGTEIKSVRLGHCSIDESFASDKDGELYLLNSYIAEYKSAHQFNHETRRPRKLLLHKKEMNRLMGAIQRQGITVIPLSFYFNPKGRLKVELGLAKGKKQHDKRATQKDRDWNRDKGRILKVYNQ
jgi:SsrA-binding protein